MHRHLPSLSGLPLLLALLCVNSGWAQTRTQSVSSAIDTRLGYNVNSRLGGREGGEWAAEVTPSISVQSRIGNIVGFLDYGLTLVERSRREPSSEVFNRLSSRFSAEVLSRYLYLDGSASISQQSLSPFGLQSVGASPSDNPNRTEVGTASLSPVLRGVIAGAVIAEARLNVSTLNTRDTTVGDNTQTGGSLSLSSALPGTLVSWGLSARSSQTDYRIGRTRRTDSASASLNWQADSDLLLSARAGTETQNVQELDSQRSSTWGMGVTWRPSPRTRVQLSYDDRFFGRGYGASAEYRWPRTTFSWSSSRDISSGEGTVEPLSQFQQFMNLLANEIPDPIAREAEVRRLLSSLGLDPTAVARPGFVLASVSVLERHQFNWAWAGQRLSFSAQVSSSSTRAIDSALDAVSREPIRLSGYSVNMAYRLAPSRTISAVGSRQMTKATATRGSNDLKSVGLTLTEQIGRRTNASISARYTVFNSAIDPYREAAVVASLGMRF